MHIFSNDFLFNHSLVTIDIVESDAYNSLIHMKRVPAIVSYFNCRVIEKKNINLLT